MGEVGEELPTRALCPGKWRRPFMIVLLRQLRCTSKSPLACISYGDTGACEASGMDDRVSHMRCLSLKQWHKWNAKSARIGPSSGLKLSFSR